MEEHDYETEIITEILAFWEKIPNSPLQELAENVEIPKAAKLWEKDVTLFYRRFMQQPDNSNFQVWWDDDYWKYYRSVWIESRHSGFPLSLLYPKAFFELQGLSRTFYKEVARLWSMESNKSLQRFFEIITTKSRTILADLDFDELTFLKATARSISDLAAQDFPKTDLAIYQYYPEKTGLSDNLAEIYYRLCAYGILRTRSLINFSKIGLTPYLLVTTRNLEKFEQDYCFFHVKSSKIGINLIGLALPPVSIALGWQDSLANEIEFSEIRFFSRGCNLSQLSTAGWEQSPPSFSTTPNDQCFGQVILDFHTVPAELLSSDALYLEHAQMASPKNLKGRIGKDGQQRLHEFATMGVIHPTYTYGSIQLSSSLVILFCHGFTTSLDKVQEAACHFPLFRVLRGTDWILIVLKMPSTWLSSAETSLKELTSQLPITDLTIDIDHRFAAERYLQFSKLWDPEKKTWVVWDS
jgi:hypothetical protein